MEQYEKAGSYSDYVLASCCMPVLLRKKPSSIVTLRKALLEEETTFYVEFYNKLKAAGAEYTVLAEDERCVFLFIFQRELIRAFYCGHKNHEPLDGYQCGGDEFCVERFLQTLKKRFTDYKSGSTDFPHEIGIFLGYPVGDVENYIAHNGKNYLVCGYWKVYDNLDKAVQKFRLYDEYKHKALEMFKSGKELNEIVTCLAY